MINCGLQDRYRTYEAAKKALSIANRLGQPYKGRGMSLLNKHRNEYLWACRGGRSKSHIGYDFETTVAGIPCGVHVLYYESATPSTFHEEGCEAEFEYHLTDLNGYRAKWLEAKLTDADEARIFEEYENERA